MSWLTEACQTPDPLSKELAIERQNQLTKPSGSLAELENIAVTLASLQKTVHPKVDRPWISLFAADHGIMAENISAYPQVVTRQMLQNFTSGGACISVIAKQYDATLQVIDCGTAGEPRNYPNVENHAISAGTRNFLHETAMTENQCHLALAIGRNSVEQAVHHKASLFIAGEMGIGNTCSASAVACFLLNQKAELMTGIGTGIAPEKLQHKINVIDMAVQRHAHYVNQDPFKALCAVGGFEIAAMVGAYIRCAQLGLPIVVDGFITTVSALVAARLNPMVRPWMLFGHQSAEYAHQHLLHALNANPILNLNLRLGEGSGAGTALGIIKLACELHNHMATFTEAAIQQQ